jgi:hypothetical protein
MKTALALVAITQVIMVAMANLYRGPTTRAVVEATEAEVKVAEVVEVIEAILIHQIQRNGDHHPK